LEAILERIRHQTKYNRDFIGQVILRNGVRPANVCCASRKNPHQRNSRVLQKYAKSKVRLHHTDMYVIAMYGYNGSISKKERMETI